MSHIPKDRKMYFSLCFGFATLDTLQVNVYCFNRANEGGQKNVLFQFFAVVMPKLPFDYIQNVFRLDEH